jgi:hypothetical protein
LKINLLEFLNLLEFIKVNYLMSRVDFKLRLHKKLPLSVKEILYPVLQGYDSLKINSSLELGGSDQLFNMLIGRDIQGGLGLGGGQSLITFSLLLGLNSSKKMSKSLGNCIFIRESFKSIYAKAGVGVTVKDYLSKTLSIQDSILVGFGFINSLDPTLLNYLFIKKINSYPYHEFKDYLNICFLKKKVIILPKFFINTNCRVSFKDVLKLNFMFKNKNKKVYRLVKGGALKVHGVRCECLNKKTSFNYQITKVLFLNKGFFVI